MFRDGSIWKFLLGANLPVWVRAVTAASDWYQQKQSIYQAWKMDAFSVEVKGVTFAHLNFGISKLIA